MGIDVGEGITQETLRALLTFQTESSNVIRAMETEYRNMAQSILNDYKYTPPTDSRSTASKITSDFQFYPPANAKATVAPEYRSALGASGGGSGAGTVYAMAQPKVNPYLGGADNSRVVNINSPLYNIEKQEVKDGADRQLVRNDIDRALTKALAYLK